MHVVGIGQQATPRFGPRHTFKVASPVLVKSKEVDGRVKHYIYSDPEAGVALTATFHHKLNAAGLGAPHNAATVSFDKSYRNPKTKVVRIKEIDNRASVCPVIVEGTPTPGRPPSRPSVLIEPVWV